MLDRDLWITQRQAAKRLGIAYGSFLRLAVLSGIRKRVLPGTWTKFHAGDVEDVLAKSIQGEGRVGSIADDRKEEDGPRLIRQDLAGAAPTQHPTKKAEVLTR